MKEMNTFDSRRAHVTLEHTSCVCPNRLLHDADCALMTTMMTTMMMLLFTADATVLMMRLTAIMTLIDEPLPIGGTSS